MSTVAGLVNKEIAALWNCSVRTVVRRKRWLKLTPFNFFGRQPVYDPAAVDRAEKKRIAELRRRNGHRKP
jgi:hypothetical protein